MTQIRVTATTQVTIVVPTATPPPATPTADRGRPAKVAVDGANVRSGPGKTYPAVTAFEDGKEILITGISEDGLWYSVRDPEDEQVGWMSAGVVSARASDLAGLPGASSVPPTQSPATPTRTPRPASTHTRVPTRRPTSTRAPTSTRRPTATPAPQINVTVVITNNTKAALSCTYTGPIRRSFSVGAWDTVTVSFAEGTYSYLCTSPGYEDQSGFESLSRGEWVWTYSDVP